MKSDDWKNNTNEEALENNNTQESHPPGELKWSQEEEDLREKQSDSKETDLDSLVTNSSQELENKEKDERNNWDNKENPFPPSTSHQQASASIEDTLTPLDFKDYTVAPTVEQIDPVQQEVVSETDQPKSKWANKWLKIFWVPALLVVMLLFGLIIGHSVLGEQPIANVFDIKTWEHLYNLVYSK
ncbi:DNA-directed RNA polymerase subunit beta [Risungbinella massiliensis]|uniref:DNA-directed RNA polymerase subunit beta n=1 Tax=Risungbinella massiliensis TaxID=1329796 RepID=UPI00069C7C90|nr:DNA-directed RNA polymerase subunit beta [Risungbinella massiliensis]